MRPGDRMSAPVMTGHAPIGAENAGSALAIARDRSERIRRGMESFIATRREIAAAYAARDWATLGYESFDAYREGEFGEPRLKLTPDERREAVAELRLGGMSQRAIGSVLGVSQSSVRDDLAQLSTSTQLPETVTGADGKDRPATRPAPEAKPDLAPTILAALAGAGRDGLDLKAIAGVFAEPPADKDLTRALEKLVKAGEIVVTRAWANGKPRKWAAASVAGDLTPDVLRVLADAGADGALAFRVAFLIDNAARPVDRVTEVLHRLAAAGQVTIVGTVEGGNLWALTELVDTQTPGPVEADAAPSAVPGSNSLIPAPIAAHYETGAWKGDKPGECGIECACGVTFDGFDSLAEAAECLARHIETPGSVEADAPVPSADPGIDQEPAAKPTLTLVPGADAVAAAERRDARALLSRGVNLLAPARWTEGNVESWIRRMGADDDELAELKARAAAAIAVLTKVIEEAGR